MEAGVVSCIRQAPDTPLQMLRPASFAAMLASGMCSRTGAETDVEHDERHRGEAGIGAIQADDTTTAVAIFRRGRA